MRRVALVVLALLFVGCASVAPDPDASLPRYMAERSWFEARYADDPANASGQAFDDYLLWAQRFYAGSYLYSRGWSQTVDEVAAALPAGEPRQRVRERMIALGRRISAEWPKDNEHRVIHTRHMAIWGDALREAIDRGEVSTLLTQVEADVDGLLAGELAPTAIAYDRYYPVDEDDPFAPF